MTQCHSTAYIVVDGNEVGMLACELEARHDERVLVGLGEHIPGGYRRPEDEWHGTARYYPATPHAHTLTWADVTTEDIDEAFDPDETFDLEVDIAPAEVIEHQARVTADAEPVEPTACGVCGRELMPLGPGGRHGWAHLTGPTPEHPWHEASPA